MPRRSGRTRRTNRKIRRKTNRRKTNRKNTKYIKRIGSKIVNSYKNLSKRNQSKINYRGGAGLDTNPNAHQDLFKMLPPDYNMAYQVSNPLLGPIFDDFFASSGKKKVRIKCAVFAKQNLLGYLQKHSGPTPPELEYTALKYGEIIAKHTTITTPENTVNFRDSTEGDSIMEAIKNGAGVILNPANQKYPGGGVFNFRDMTAMEENLCRQSNLITQLLYAHTQLLNAHKQITKGDGTRFSYLGHCGEPHQTAISTYSTFKFVKFAPNVFRRLSRDYGFPVLSIASPDMKNEQKNTTTLNDYYRKMKQYWGLAIESTTRYYESSPQKPKLIAVMPGDFIKLGGSRDDPDPHFARVAAIALKEVLDRLNPRIDIVFARETAETLICRGVIDNGLQADTQFSSLLAEVDPSVSLPAAQYSIEPEPEVGLESGREAVEGARVKAEAAARVKAEAAARVKAEAAASAVNIILVPNMFTGTGKLGDFLWMIKQPELDHDFYIFWDNLKKQGGKMQTLLRREDRAIGIPIGSANATADDGFENLTDNHTIRADRRGKTQTHTAKHYIDYYIRRGIEKIAETITQDIERGDSKTEYKLYWPAVQLPAQGGYRCSIEFLDVDETVQTYILKKIEEIQAKVMKKIG
jgi:hypothetical protein